MTINKMTKFKNTLSLIFSNVGLSVCIYFGIYKGITGVMNILSFLIWFSFIVLIFTFWNDEVQITTYKKVKSRLSFGIFEVLFDILCVAILVFYGHFLLGSLLAVGLILQQYCINKGKELVESAD